VDGERGTGVARWLMSGSSEVTTAAPRDLATRTTDASTMSDVPAIAHSKPTSPRQRLVEGFGHAPAEQLQQRRLGTTAPRLGEHPRWHDRRDPTSPGRCARRRPARRCRRRTRVVRQRSTDELVEVAVGRRAFVGRQQVLLGPPFGDRSQAILDTQAGACGIVEPRRQALTSVLSDRGRRIRDLGAARWRASLRP